MRRFYSDDDRPEEEEIDDEEMAEIINIIAIDDVVHDQKLALILNKALEIAKQDMFWRFRSLSSRLNRVRKSFKACKKMMEMETN